MKKFKFTFSSEYKKSMGISSLMQNTATVFFHEISNSIHLGNVSDLIAAQVKESQVSELNLRAMILFMYFDLFGFESGMSSGFSQKKFKTLSFECAVDSEKFGISISFILKEGESLSLEEAQKSLQVNDYNNPFYSLIHKSTLFSNKILVKYHPEKRKCEFTVLLALPETSFEEIEGSGVEFEWIDLEGDIQNPPLPKSYKELGDLDPIKNGNNLDEKNEGFEKKFSAEDPIKEEWIKIRSSNPELEEAFIRLSGGESEFENLTPVQHIKLYLNMIQELQQKLKDSNNALDKQKDKKDSGGGVFGLFKKPNTQKEKSEDNAQEESLKSIKDIEEHVLKDYKKDTKNLLKKTYLEYSEELVKHIHTHGLYDVIKAKHNELLVHKGLIQDPEVVKWLNSFFEELISKRQVLMDYSQSLYDILKQEKDALKDEEKKLQEQLKQKDEIIRNKTTALANLKEQVNQLNVNSERLKNSSKSLMADAAYKKKFELQEKTLENTKKDTARLRAKIDVMTKELNQLKQSSRSNKPSADSEKLSVDLKNSSEEIQKLKKENQDLTGKVKANERTLEPLNRQIKEAKNQMQKASAMLAQKKKELDEAKNKNLQLERDKNKLILELDALKKLNQKSSTSGDAAA